MFDIDEIRGRLVVSSLGVMNLESTEQRVFVGGEEVVVDCLVITVPGCEEDSEETDDDLTESA